MATSITKAKGGRPRKIASAQDIRTIEAMAARGAVLDAIAKVIGISGSTLDRWMTDDAVRAAYERGRAIAADEMGQRLWAIAMQDGCLKSATTAAIFWLKAQANWSDKPKEMEVNTAANVVVYLPDNGRSSAA
ncbi:MAG: hypothetical protein AAFZ49_00205 [Cyanobacteria bacterium J06659_2]